MKFCLQSALLFCLSFPHGISAQVKVGQIAPALTLGPVLRGKFDSRNLSQPTVVEFWATWCGPCVANIPHLNDLAAKFEGRGVRFLSLTPENADVVERFLNVHPISGTVALDPGQAMSKTYGAGTPTTVLIDRNGRVVRKIHPALVGESVIDDLAFDRPVQVPAIRDDMYPPQGGGPFRESASDTSTVVKVTIAPSAKQSGGVTFLRPPGKIANHVKSDGATLPDLLGFAFDLSPYRVIVSKYLQGGRYALDAWVPEDRGDLLKPMVRNALEAAIDYRPRMEQRAFDVLVLKGLPGKFVRVTGDLGQDKAERGLLDGDQLSLEELRKTLERQLDKPVLIDNMPEGNFRWHLQWNASEPDGLIRALREQAGLELHAESRRLSVVVADTATPTVAAAN